MSAASAWSTVMPKAASSFDTQNVLYTIVCRSIYTHRSAQEIDTPVRLDNVAYRVHRNCFRLAQHSTAR